MFSFSSSSSYHQNSLPSLSYPWLETRERNTTHPQSFFPRHLPLLLSNNLCRVVKMSSKPSGHYLESSRKRGSQQSQRAPQPSYRGAQPAQHSPQYYRRHATAIDHYLYEKGLKRKYIAKDGSCLFRAVSEQVCSYQPESLTFSCSFSTFRSGWYKLTIGL